MTGIMRRETVNTGIDRVKRIPAMISLWLCVWLAHPVISPDVRAQEQPLSDIELRSKVKHAIKLGTDYLRRSQLSDGTWPIAYDPIKEATVGVTALAVLAQINCDVPVKSKTIQRGLNYLRSVRPSELGARSQIYEASLLIMALCAAEEYDRDLGFIRQWTNALQQSQTTEGEASGLWNYVLTNGREPSGGDRSNGQFAVLALRDAVNAGAEVDQAVWERVRDHWDGLQNPDGGWGYFGYKHGRGRDNPSRGSMTAAGLSTLAITSRMIADDSDVDAEGRIDPCTPHPPPPALLKGRHYIGNRFSARRNPGADGWHYYYLYALERAGRLTGVRFFGGHDWYRAGARVLQPAQQPNGSWLPPGSHEADPVLATSYALLFLSKGLSRVVVNKLDYESTEKQEMPEGEWNRHHLDIPNLIAHIDSLPGWPPRLNSQILELNKLKAPTAVLDMNQAPVLYISGSNAPAFSDEQVEWLRRYVDEGGFIFGQANCVGGTFDASFKDLVRRMFPDGEATLNRLAPDHPLFRSEYLLQEASLEVYGVDFGCRTPIVYSPVDHACYWHKWMRRPPQTRSTDLNQRIERSMRLGVNVIAYATGREPPEKLNEAMQSKDALKQAERGLLEVAQIQHDGGWDTAPRAVSNLLEGLSQETGIGVSLKPRPVPVTFEALRRFPMAYMHGRYGFRLRETEQNALRDYLSRGPVLIADACCGSERFDRSFRTLMTQLYPENPLQPIPSEHEMFSEKTGFDTRTVRRRRLLPARESASLRVQVESGPPVIEGIQIEGQYVVIYSKYDLSCALENQASLACDGYLKEDAMHLAINLVLYGLYLQDFTIQPDEPE
jgi:hypothetical protein